MNRGKLRCFNVYKATKQWPTMVTSCPFLEGRVHWWPQGHRPERVQSDTRKMWSKLLHRLVPRTHMLENHDFFSFCKGMGCATCK